MVQQTETTPGLLAKPGQKAVIYIPACQLGVEEAETFMCNLIDRIEQARAHDGDPI